MLNKQILDNFNIILASKSPRRHQLLKGLDINFNIDVRSVKEIYPAEISVDSVAEYLAKIKADAFDSDKLAENDIVITSDTVVVLGNKIIGKPKDRGNAIEIIKSLSGNKHKVITAVCFKSQKKQYSFSVETIVYFKHIEEEDIVYYIDKYMPFDKAGAYGIQEWIGYIGIEKIEGSFYNVMGFPTQRVYDELVNFVK